MVYLLEHILVLVTWSCRLNQLISGRGWKHDMWTTHNLSPHVALHYIYHIKKWMCNLDAQFKFENSWFLLSNSFISDPWSHFVVVIKYTASALLYQFYLVIWWCICWENRGLSYLSWTILKRRKFYIDLRHPICTSIILSLIVRGKSVQFFIFIDLSTQEQ